MQNSILRGLRSGKSPCRLFLRKFGPSSEATTLQCNYRRSNRDICTSSFRATNSMNRRKMTKLSKMPFSSRPDPFARRPTSKCDPYGQDGKPLTLDQVLGLTKTIEPEWKIMMGDDDKTDDEIQPGSETKNVVPFAIRRVYWHDDYLSGSRFSTHVAAVAQMNAQHFPHEVILSRKLDSKTKTWRICTEIICRTHVLQGLSHHDFYLATLIDIEAERPEVRGLLSSDEQNI